MKNSVASRIVGRLQEFTEALEKDRNISQQFNCSTVQLLLKPKPYLPEAVKETRRKVGASQAVFAMLLGVSVRAVRSWEQGRQEPSGMASRFMDEIRDNPPYWIERLKACVIEK